MTIRSRAPRPLPFYSEYDRTLIESAAARLRCFTLLPIRKVLNNLQCYYGLKICLALLLFSSKFTAASRSRTPSSAYTYLGKIWCQHHIAYEASYPSRCNST